MREALDGLTDPKGRAVLFRMGMASGELLRDRFDLEERGLIEGRGKGPVRTWHLIGRKAAAPVA